MVAARIDYVELPSATAHELTRAFYSKAFGWAFSDYGPTYSATTNGTTDVGLQGDPNDALSAPLPVQGGRARKYFVLTAAGDRALSHATAMLARMMQGWRPRTAR